MLAHIGSRQSVKKGRRLDSLPFVGSINIASRSKVKNGSGRGEADADATQSLPAPKRRAF